MMGKEKEMEEQPCKLCDQFRHGLFLSFLHHSRELDRPGVEYVCTRAGGITLSAPMTALRFQLYDL